MRVDSHVYPGYLVPPYYDSLLGKLIVWGRDREECLARSRWALDQFLVDGVKTVIPFHRLVLDHPLFMAGDVNTHFIEDHLGCFMPLLGWVTLRIPPGRPWVRLDTHVYQGQHGAVVDQSLLGKPSCGRDREERLARSRWALDQFLVDGVKTVIPFHRLVLDVPLFKAGDVNTHFIEDHGDVYRPCRTGEAQGRLHGRT